MMQPSLLPDPPAEGPRPGGRGELALPREIAAAVWRGNELGSPVTDVIPTGWSDLDAALPGGGWPCRSVTEVLQPQASLCEWRLLAHLVRDVVRRGQHVVVVGPPKEPSMMGLRHYGLDDKHFVWIKAETPAHRLWSTEQLVRGNACGLVMAWFNQVRPEQIRRLQVSAQHCEAPVVLFRPEAAQFEASAAPLRLIVRFGMDWELHVQVLKRRGVPLEDILRLPSIPGGLGSVLTPRLRIPSRLIAERETQPHALGGTATRQALRRRISA